MLYSCTHIQAKTHSTRMHHWSLSLLHTQTHAHTHTVIIFPHPPCCLLYIVNSYCRYYVAAPFILVFRLSNGRYNPQEIHTERFNLLWRKFFIRVSANILTNDSQIHNIPYNHSYSIWLTWFKRGLQDNSIYTLLFSLASLYNNYNTYCICLQGLLYYRSSCHFAI